jgi:hypothetical protein
VGFGVLVLVGGGVSVIVGEGIGELVRVGGGRGELVRVGTNVGVRWGLALPACLGRWVFVGGGKVMEAVIVGEINVTVGENVILWEVDVLDGMIVGVIRF